LSHVPIAELELAQQMAADLDASSLIEGLIEQAMPGAKFNMASIGHARLDGNGQPDMWVIVTLNNGRNAFSALLTPAGATAFAEPSHDVIGHVSKRDDNGDVSQAA
jgi:hypothetical protein